jgi:hypothetical protein
MSAQGAPAIFYVAAGSSSGIYHIRVVRKFVPNPKGTPFVRRRVPRAGETERKQLC